MAAQLFSDSPLVVIVGPTASGKTSLVIRLAQRHGGEIICADSRTVYRDMNIGTAKPTAEEQIIVPHWGLDLVDPGEYFSAVRFKEYAVQKINEIRTRGKIPFLVGGTGLYINAVVFDFSFGNPANAKERDLLNAMTLKQLQEYCLKNNIELPENHQNKRHVVRNIERKNIRGICQEKIREDTIIVGITTDKNKLRQRIKARLEHIFSDNVVKETIMLGKKYGWESEAMTGNIYNLIRRQLTGDLAEGELINRAIIQDWQLAKRQMTWFRRNPYIMWGDLESAEQYIDKIIGRID